jgi:hypothetical protein
MPAFCALALCLHLVNVSGAPPALVAEAQRQLEASYDSIGVPIVWTDDPRSILVIVRDDEPGYLRRPTQPLLGVAIRAARGTPVAYVFYRRTAEQADHYGVPRPSLVASTMAHEIGHLLLPEREHAATGLMRGCWDSDEFFSAARGALHFLPDEAAAIRTQFVH